MTVTVWVGAHFMTVHRLCAFLIGGPAPGSFAIKRIEKFAITDATLLPDGDLLILERSFSWPEGLSCRSGASRSEMSTLVRSSMVRCSSRRTCAAVIGPMPGIVISIRQVELPCTTVTRRRSSAVHLQEISPRAA